MRMKKNESLPKWRIVLIAILSLVIIVCTCFIGRLDDIIDYNLTCVDDWYYKKDISHIGNISRLDSRGKWLGGDWWNIGNHYWHEDDIADVDFGDEFGELIQFYSYRIDDGSDPNDGEIGKFGIFDISSKLAQTDMDMNKFYHTVYNECISDTNSIWKPTEEFAPFLALYTRPYIAISKTEPGLIYKERFIIFANYRVYYFSFYNDKYHKKGTERFDSFHKRCKKIVDDIDFISYTKWEIDYNNYIELSKKQKQERELWDYILYSIVLLCCICIFILGIKKIGKSNSKARTQMLYAIVCTTIGLLAMAIEAFNSPIEKEKFVWLTMVFFPSFIINIFITTFLVKKSNEEDNSYYLIPVKFSKYLNINTEFGKRLALLCIFYPLFWLVPIPVLGLVIFICYILPVIILLWFCIGIKKIIIWLWEGKKKDSKTAVQVERKARLYCRHCGKLIDADSDYCRYCGKKL